MPFPILFPYICFRKNITPCPADTLTDSLPRACLGRSQESISPMQPLKPGVFNPQPIGNIWPTEPCHPTCRAC